MLKNGPCVFRLLLCTQYIQTNAFGGLMTKCRQRFFIVKWLILAFACQQEENFVGRNTHQNMANSVNIFEENTSIEIIVLCGCIVHLECCFIPRCYSVFPIVNIHSLLNSN